MDEFAEGMVAMVLEVVEAEVVVVVVVEDDVVAGSVRVCFLVYYSPNHSFMFIVTFSVFEFNHAKMVHVC